MVIGHTLLVVLGGFRCFLVFLVVFGRYRTFSVVFGGYRWFSVVIGSYRWLSVVIGGYRWLSVSIGGYWTLSVVRQGGQGGWSPPGNHFVPHLELTDAMYHSTKFQVFTPNTFGETFALPPLGRGGQGGLSRNTCLRGFLLYAASK